MRRVATWLLVGFLGLAAGLGTMVAWQVRARPPAAPEAPAPSADYRVTEIHIDETVEGSLRWTLDADQAEVYDREQRTLMHNVAIRLFTRDGQWTVRAQRGILDNQTRDVSLSGDVVLASSDGLRMTTPTLRWRHQARHLFTEDPVEITRDGTRIVGRGLDVFMAEERAVVGRRVRVEIADRQRARLGLFPRSGS